MYYSARIDATMYHKETSRLPLEHASVLRLPQCHAALSQCNCYIQTHCIQYTEDTMIMRLYERAQAHHTPHMLRS